MKKLVSYFPHDSNAKDDPKITLLIDQLGLEGFGIFWVLIETLRDQPDYKYPLQLLPSLARKYATTFEKIKLVVFNYNLFEFEKDVLFYSQSLNARMIPLENTREQRKQAGIASARKRQLTALKEAQDVEKELNALLPEINDRSTTVQQPFNKVKESRIEENKINNNNNEIQNFAVVAEPLKSYRKGLETNEQHKNDIRENKHEDRIKTFLLTYHINKDYSLRNEIEVFVLEQDLKEPDQRRTITQFITHLVSWLLKGDKIRHNTEQERKEVLTRLKTKSDGFTK